MTTASVPGIASTDGLHASPSPIDCVNALLTGALLCALSASAAMGQAIPHPFPPTVEPAPAAQPASTPELELDQCLEIALQNHPTLKTLRGSLGVARARVIRSRAGRLPRLSLNVSRTHTELIRPGTSSLASVSGGVIIGGGSASRVVESDIKRATLNLRQTLTDFGKTENEIAASKHSREAARLELENTVQDVILDAEVAYFQLLAARSLAKVNRQAVARALEDLKVTEGFVEVGSRPRFDLTRARVEVSTARVAARRTENEVEISRVILANAMGLEGKLPGEPRDRPRSKLPILSPDEATSQGLENRPDLVASLERQRSAEASLHAAQAGYRPSINVGYGKTLRGEDYPLDRSTDVSLSMDWNLFDGHLTHSQVAEARANLAVSQGRTAQLRQQVITDIRRYQLNAQEADARIEATAITVREARENLLLARGRYQGGVGSPIEITDARLSLARAESDQVQARYDFEIALARLERAMGLINREEEP